MNSVWQQTAVLPAFEPLDGDVSAEVLVIGGGITGILCARMLHQSGARVVLAEADTICSGITKNTTAKITAQHGLIYSRIAKEFGLKQAKLYLEANEAARLRYEKLCAGIDCDYERKDAVVYARRDRAKLEKEMDTLTQIGYQAELVDRVPLPFQVEGAIRFPDQAQFHPLKFVAAMTEGLEIYAHTRVRDLKGTTAFTGHGRIFAEKIIVATHFPFINRHGSYFVKMEQHRSYVIALENAADVGAMFVDEAQNGLSFRNYGKLLLLGGGGHRTGKKGGNWAELRAFAKKAYPNAREYAHWATQDCMTLDGIPYIGPYSARTKGLYVATGFNKWGMTSAMAAAQLLCDLLQRKENPYAELFSPSRSILRPQLAVNAAEAVTNLLTPTVPRCPHLGCALKWNAQEHSWDCPCHGSRFTENGQLIDNPATDEVHLRGKTHKSG